MCLSWLNGTQPLHCWNTCQYLDDDEHRSSNGSVKSSCNKLRMSVASYVVLDQ